MLHYKHPLHEAEIQRGDARERGQLLADEGFFHRAVHVHDTIDGTARCGCVQKILIHFLWRFMLMAAAVSVMLMPVMVLTGSHDFLQM